MATNELERLNGVNLDTAYETPADVANAMGELEHAFTATAPVSRLGVFVTAYRYITLELCQRLKDDTDGATHHFQDPAWVGRYLVTFANLYRVALSAYKHGQMPAVPLPWRLAFDAAIADETVVLQDLLLGINAHINNDLPRALQTVGIEPRDRRRADHEAINDALRAATDAVQEHLSHLYGSFLGLLDWAGGPLDEDITNFSFQKAREEAWNSGVALVDNTTTPQEIEQNAAVLARLILTISTTAPEVTAALHWFEEVWQQTFSVSDDVTAPPTEDGLTKLVRKIVDPSDAPESIKAEAVMPTPAGSPLAQAMSRLTTTIAELDQQRSRQALNAGLYREILRQVNRASLAGQFQDPQWIAAVQDNCVRLYLNALQAFRTGETAKLPASWRLVFEGAQRDDIIVPQVLALGVTAYLAHDAPIALLRTRFYADVAGHQLDYDRLAAIARSCLDAAIAAATGRYGRVLDGVENLPATLSQLLCRFDCADTATMGCKNAAALAAARKTDSHAGFRVLDRETSERAQCIVVPGLVQHEWVIPALRQYENRWTGAWSEWISVPATLYGHVLRDAIADLAPEVRDFISEPDARRATGTVRLVRGRGWWPPFLADALGFPAAGKAIPLHLEVVAQDDQEHWFQILGTQAWATQHWAHNGNLIVAYGPLRFTFKLVADAGALRFEQIGTALLALPLPRRLAPEIQVEVEARNDGLDLDVSVHSPILGEVVRYAGRIVAQ